MATTINVGTGSGGVGTSSVALKTTLTFPEGSVLSIDYEVKNANSPMVLQKLDLTNGFNPIDSTKFVDISKAGGVVIIPPSSNAQSLTLKGVTVDTGVALSKIAPTVITFDKTPPTSFGITAGGAVTGVQLLWF